MSHFSVDSFKNLIDLVEKDVNQTKKILIKGFAIVGLFYASKCFIKLSIKTFPFFKSLFFKPTQLCISRPGKWAIVVGCDELGLEFAKVLADKGLNVFLVDEYFERLENFKHNIEKLSSSKIELLQVNFVKLQETLEKIQEFLIDKQILLLVLNTDERKSWNFFCNEPPSVMIKTINNNILLPAMISRLILPSMVEAREGGVVFVSSALSSFQSPRWWFYSITKHFTSKLIEKISKECGKSGLSFVTLHPMNVITKEPSIFKPNQPNAFNPSPADYASSALSNLPINRHLETSGYFYHSLQFFLYNMLNKCILIRRLIYL